MEREVTSFGISILPLSNAEQLEILEGLTKVGSRLVIGKRETSREYLTVCKTESGFEVSYQLYGADRSNVIDCADYKFSKLGEVQYGAGTLPPSKLLRLAKDNVSQA